MRFRAAVVWFVLLAATAFAQSDRGVITGTVLDPSGAVVPGATVSAIHSGTGVVTKTVTTETGNFALPSLPAGIYSVTAELAGFKEFVQRGIQVQVAQTVRLDIHLEMGAASESVTVSAEALVLKTENAEQSMNFNNDQITALPLNFGGGGGSSGGLRNPFTFNVLSPGVVGSGSSANINGLPTNTFRMQVEGQNVSSVNDTNMTAATNRPSVEMVSDFSLQTSNFSAEYGHAGSGFYNFTTRSGTNQFHGSAYEYLTNEVLDAYRPNTFVRPKDRKNDFGGFFSGPVVIPKLYNGRDKTFFFFNLEVFRNNASSAGTFMTLPTAAMRNGNFSEILTQRQLGTDALGRPIMENTIYDPTTARVVNGQTITDAFSGNIIPTARFDAVAAKIQALIPAPTNAALVNNFANDYLRPYNQSVPSFKIDHNFANNSRLTFYFSAQSTHQQTGTDALPAPITGTRVQYVTGYTERLNFDRSLTPRLLLHLGAGNNRFYNPDSAPDSVLKYDAAGKLGYHGSSMNPSGFPRINNLSGGGIGAGSSVGFGPSDAFQYHDTTTTGVASAFYVRGNHSYKLGAEFRLDGFVGISLQGAQGILNFSGAETAMPYLVTTSVGGGNIGFPYASFLLGQVDTASVNNPQDPQLRKKAWGLYIQDNWKISRRLTLDYGLRWDLDSQGHEAHWRTSMFGPTIPNPSAGNLPGALVYEGYGPGRCNCQFTRTYPYAIGPRLGLAYQITPKTVLRAGWGLVYGALPMYWYITDIKMLGVGFNQLVWSSPAYGTPGVILSQGLQYNISDLYAVTLNPGLVPSPGQLNSPNLYIDPNGGRPSRINQWNISVQRELMPGMVLEAAYVGNRAAWLQANSLINLNAVKPATLVARGIDVTNADDRTLLTSRLNSSLAQSRGFTAPYAGYPSSATVLQSLRPYPQFGGIGVYWAPLGKSWYDSLQTKLTKRLSNGLQLIAAFTWSKTLANPGGSVNNVFNRANQKSITSFDRPFMFNIGYLYELPKLSTNKLIRQLLGEWTLAGVLQYKSGGPIASPSSRNNLSSVLNQNTLMNRNPGVPLFTKDLNCHCIDPYKDFVLNPAAWSDPAPGTWGTAAAYYSDYRTARIPLESMSLGRTFRFRERMSFQIRAEFFNVFNRRELANPTSSNPLATQQRDAAGNAIGGFGYINPTATGLAPRNGQLVARFSF